MGFKMRAKRLLKKVNPWRGARFDKRAEARAERLQQQNKAVESIRMKSRSLGAELGERERRFLKHLSPKWAEEMRCTLNGITSEKHFRWGLEAGMEYIRMARQGEEPKPVDPMKGQHFRRYVDEGIARRAAEGKGKR